MSANGPVCAPDCRQQGCPSGKQCLHITRDLWSCSILAGEDCEQTGCPKGRECKAFWSEDVVEKLCVMPCQFEDQCPTGTFCSTPGYCVLRCNRDLPKACPPRHTCVLFEPKKDNAFGCLWDGHAGGEGPDSGRPSP